MKRVLLKATKKQSMGMVLHQPYIQKRYKKEVDELVPTKNVWTGKALRKQLAETGTSKTLNTSGTNAQKCSHRFSPTNGIEPSFVSVKQLKHGVLKQVVPCYPMKTL